MRRETPARPYATGTTHLRAFRTIAARPIGPHALRVLDEHLAQLARLMTPRGDIAGELLVTKAATHSARRRPSGVARAEAKTKCLHSAW